MEIKVQDLWMVWEQKVLKGVWQFKKKKKKKGDLGSDFSIGVWYF